MKLLLTGAHGQVGQEIAALAQQSDCSLLALDRTALDITDPQAVRIAVNAFRPNVTINAAAFTAVDLAESQPSQAFAVNRDGPAHLAAACAAIDCPLIHLSTDYVFDGSSPTPYTETDPAAPIGVYGQSKYDGEEAIRTLWSRHLIVRVSWVFGFHGRNFVKTMLRLAREKETLAVVRDQWGGPTPADAIADTLLTLARRIATEPTFQEWGTYHYCGEPGVSWHEFAAFIIAQARQRIPLAVQEIRGITTAEYPTPARRPANSRLDCQQIATRLGIAPADWQQAVHILMPRLLP
ncbi:MAG: dTDP-4-dehydrorhamnose reductase [Magnetococcales bacterium]|nr:dTDP-4-dehydrorhamnose reductase [Magnetococcales bacterium]